MSNTTNSIDVMSYPTAIALQRPLVERLGRFVTAGFVPAWRDLQARRHRDRCVEALAGLSGAVLRDIGAPDELLIQAASRQRADAQRLDELRIVANYRGIDTRFW